MASYCQQIFCERRHSSMNAISCQGTTTNPEILAIGRSYLSHITRLSIQRAAGVVGNDPTVTLPTASGRRVRPSIERSARDFLLSYQTLNSSAVSRLTGASPTAGGSGMMLTRASSPSVRLAMTLNFASEGSVLAQAQADNYFAGLRLISSLCRKLEVEPDDKRCGGSYGQASLYSPDFGCSRPKAH